MQPNRLLRLVKNFIYVNRPEYGIFTNAANIMYLQEQGAILKATEIDYIKGKIAIGDSHSSHYYFKVKQGSPLAKMIDDVYNHTTHDKKG